MDKLIIAAAKRALRTAVATGIPALVQYMTNSTNPVITLVAAPALMGLGKLLRDKYGWTWIPV